VIPVQDVSASQALQRRYALVGKVPLEVDETIVPVCVVDTLDLQRDRFAAGLVGQSAVALEFANLQLFNPAASGVLITMERAFIALGTAGVFGVQFFDTALTTENTFKQFRDRRLPGAPIGQTRRQGGTSSLGVANLFFEYDLAVADEHVQFPMDITLLPGQGVVFVPNLVNIGLRSDFYWKESNLLPGD